MTTILGLIVVVIAACVGLAVALKMPPPRVGRQDGMEIRGPRLQVWPIKQLRRHRIRMQPTPLSEIKKVWSYVSPFGRLPSIADQIELLYRMGVFQAEKRFEGCGGFQLDEMHRLVISAYACLPLLHRKRWCYPDLDSVLVYPANYAAPVCRPGPCGDVGEGVEEHAGESRPGAVVLSWEDVVRTSLNPSSSRNVIIHEFAHQIDAESGAYNGAPKFEKGENEDEWAKILGEEYLALVRRIEEQAPSCIDPYAVHNPIEFFAVVTEHFFEIPKLLAVYHPVLYNKLREFFKQDPALWRV